MKPIRLLILEDNNLRREKLLSMLPPDIRGVVVASGGQALGLLQRTSPDDFAGILLDHDLRENTRVPADNFLSGQNVVTAIIDLFDLEIPVLIHSMNPGGRQLMFDRLHEADFTDVSVIPMAELENSGLPEYLERVRAYWKELNDLD